MGDKIAKILGSLAGGASVYGQFMDRRDTRAEQKAYRDELLAFRRESAEAAAQDKKIRQDQTLLDRMARAGKWSPEQIFDAAVSMGLRSDEVPDIETGSIEPSLSIAGGEFPNALKAFEGVSFDPSGRQTSPGGGGGKSSSLRSLIKSFGTNKGGKKKGGGGSGKGDQYFNYDPDTGKTEVYPLPKALHSAATATVNQNKMGVPEYRGRQKELKDFFVPKKEPYEQDDEELNADIINRMNLLKDAPTEFSALEAEKQRRSPNNIITSLMAEAQNKGIVKAPSTAAPAPAPIAPVPQANEALEWAKQNPNDPRSALILQKLGL